MNQHPANQREARAPQPATDQQAAPDPLILQRSGIVGTPVARLDGALKVSGQARFAAEVDYEDLAYAALVYSTVARGRIAAIDSAAAQAAPGVLLVMTHENAPTMAPPPKFMTAPKAGGNDPLPVFQDNLVHWNGQPVALVLAETQEQADHAAALVRVRYEAGEAVTSLEAAKAAGLRPATIRGAPLGAGHGDAEAALAAAPVKVDARYTTPFQNHNAIELHGVTVAWSGERLTVHDSTQSVTHTAWSLAQVFGLREDQVRVSSPYVGGGFGGKALWQHHVLAAAAARLSGRPVRLALSREGVYRVVGGRACTEQRVALGAHADGRFAALIHTGVVGMTERSVIPEPFIRSSKCLYRADAIALGVDAAWLDMLPNTAMRAPGEAVGSFALESAIDELAERLDMDPIALRLRNEPQQDPLDGRPFSSRHLAEAFTLGAARFGWERRQPRPGARREGEWLIGLGCATACYPYQRNPGGAARIRLSQEGHAHIEVAAHEMGMGTVTTQAMIAAERLGLPLERVSVACGDSTFPGVVLAGGSQQTAAIGAAVRAAWEELVRQLLALAPPDSPLAGLAPAEVMGRDGGLCKVGDARVRAGYAELLAGAGREALVAEAIAPPPLEAQRWSMHSYGAIFCEARVNAVTGEPHVSRLLGSFDGGRIINPTTAASQFRGGMIMGLRLALMEETQIDPRSGRIVNASLSDYHVPVHLDVPEIEVMWTDYPDPQAPMGARGIGEIGITGVAAAVANAVYNACGRRVRDLPITLDKLV